MNTIVEEAVNALANAVPGANKKNKGPKKPPTEKQLKMFANRAAALKNLTARLGKPARAANAARLVTLRRNKPENANKFIDDLIAREGKPVPKPKANNKPKANVAAPAKPKSKTKNKTLKAAANVAVKAKANKYFTFKYNSVERQAKKLIKKVEEIEGALKGLGMTMKDVCRVCQDLKED